MNGESSALDDVDNHTQKVNCWACKVQLMVPEVDGGQYAHEYKCGWCGAFNYWPLTNGSGATPHTNGFEKSSDSVKYYSAGFIGKLDRFLDDLEVKMDSMCPTTCVSALNMFMRGFIFVLVIILVTSLGVVGPVALLPGVFTGWKLWVSQGISAFLMYNVSFNLVASAWQNAGSVGDYFPQLGGEVQQQAFDNFKYCARCQDAKPPTAHHCRICGKCVVDMDHHCPFINNCVGRTNLRPFILFLVYVILSILYATPLLIVFLYTHRGLLFKTYIEIVRYTERVPGISSKIMFAPAYIVRIATVKWQVLCAIYLTFVCLTSFVAVVFLLYGQMQLALRGEYYINTLQSGRRTITYEYSFKNLRKIFGDGRPIFWLLPRWKNPTTVQNLAKKGT